MAVNNSLNINTATPLDLTRGGTGADLTATTNDLVYCGAAHLQLLATANSAALVTTSAGVPGYSATMTNGQLIIGSTGATPVAASLTAGTGISITPGAGSISIASTVSSLAWVDQTSTPVNPAAINTGYIIDNGVTKVVITLPSAPALGSIIEVAGNSSGLWELLPGAGDTIQIGAVNAATSVTAANQYDCIRLVYQGSALALWVMLSSVTNGFVIV